MILNLLTAILIIAGLFMVFRINPAEIGRAIFSEHDPHNMRELINQANGKQKTNLFARQFARMRDVLALTGRAEQYRRYCVIALVCAAAGIVAAVMLSNPLLIPIWAATGLFLPPLYVMLTANKYNRLINDQTASALSLVTSAYLRTENLPMSVQASLPVMRGPAKKIFTTFWLQTQYANPNVEHALQDMSGKLNNGVFREWCKTMALCQHDHTKKGMLKPLLRKQDALQAKQIELDGTLHSMVRDNQLMIIFALAGYFLLALVDRAWFLLMFTSRAGKIVTAGVAAAILFDLTRLTKATKSLA